MSAIANALYLIGKAVQHQDEGLNFTDLNDASGIPQSSAHRIVKELVELSVLEYDPKRRTYRGGLILASLGAQVLAHYSLRKVARASLEALHAQLGEVVTLGIRDQLTGIYIDKIEAPGMGYRLHSEIGKAFPLHCTAMGKVLLAHADEATQRHVLRKKLPAMTPNTITDPQALKAALASIAARGYAIDDEEITRGLVCVAAPIYDVYGKVKGALSFTCQKHMFTSGRSSEIIEHVRQAAHAASA